MLQKVRGIADCECKLIQVVYTLMCTKYHSGSLKNDNCLLVYSAVWTRHLCLWSGPQRPVEKTEAFLLTQPVSTPLLTRFAKVKRTERSETSLASWRGSDSAYQIQRSMCQRHGDKDSPTTRRSLNIPFLERKNIPRSISAGIPMPSALSPESIDRVRPLTKSHLAQCTIRYQPSFTLLVWGQMENNQPIWLLSQAFPCGYCHLFPRVQS